MSNVGVFLMSTSNVDFDIFFGARMSGTWIEC